MDTGDTVDVFDVGKDKLSDKWIEFLGNPQVYCPIDVTAATATNKYPSLSCSQNWFWDLSFSTTANEKKFSTARNYGVFQPDGYTVAGSAVLGLPSPEEPPCTSIPMNDVLTKFGLVLPDAGLVKAIVDTLITASIELKIDYSEPRSALWLTPGQLFRSDVALTFELASRTSQVLSSITTALATELGIDVSDGLASVQQPKIMLQRTCWGSDSYDGENKKSWAVITTSRLKIKLPTSGFLVWVILGPNGTSFTVTSDPTVKSPLGTFLNKLPPKGAPNDPSKSSVATPSLPGVLDDVVEFQILSLNVGTSKDITWTITAALRLASGVKIYLSYDSQASIFSGGLMLDGYYATEAEKLLPGYEAGRAIVAPAKDPPDPPLPPYVDLRELSDQLKALPSSIPTAIALASLSFQKSEHSTLWLTAKLIAPPPASPSYVPAPFEWDELDIRMSMGSTFSCNISTHFLLNSPPGKPYSPTEFGIGFRYDSDSWIMNAYANDISFGLLHGFFEDQYSDAFVSVLGKLNVASLNIMYTYEKGNDQADGKGGATSFIFTGAIRLGDLELRLFYQYASSKAGNNPAAAKKLAQVERAPKILAVQSTRGTTTSDWAFECDLGAKCTTATIGTVVSSIIDDASGLPSFVRDIPIPAAAALDASPVSMKVIKAASGLLVFALRVTIDAFTLTFVQVADKDKPKSTKRLLRFAVDKIPLVHDIPLLDKLPQPFDQLDYLWVNNSGGLLQSDVEAINTILTGENKLLYKKATTVADATKVLIAPGHHFVVIHNKQVALDHIFFASESKVTRSLSPAGVTSISTGKEVAMVKDAAPMSAPASPPSKGAVAFTLGPLSITAVTLQYKEHDNSKYLFVTMDAVFAMGPISFSLLGFSIGLSLNTAKLNDLSTLLKEAEGIQIGLAGLALSFDKPPLLLAGAFEHQVMGSGDARQEIYLGGIGLSFPPYTFVGVGEYAILNNYKSVFIYAKLDGPLIELELATISGVRMGLGFNSAVRSPSIDQLTQFPFVNDQGTSGAGNDPMKILKALCQSSSGDPIKDPAWVSPKNEAYWLAAGMTVSAFDVLAITAVAMFAFRDSSMVISLFADAVAQMPPEVTDRREMIVYVEIGLIAEMNFVDGYFRIEAALAPTSFLLVPQCHVYGGFALVYWFGANAHAGDWVFSVGGYHRSYTPPTWYPVPKRIGIAFKISDCFSVTGEAYFAITPKVAMGGAMIHASLSVGIVDAWLDTAFDALVNFHPLHYITDFKVSVGVKCTIDVWFVHVHISAHIGATLHLEGPELGGYAYVDFWVVGFKIDFGATNKIPNPLDLKEFWDMLHQPGPDSTAAEKDDANPIRSFLSFDRGDPRHSVLSTEGGAALKFVLENGNFPRSLTVDSTSTTDTTSTGVGAKWFVKGGTFQFRIVSDFALSHADIAPGISLDADKSSTVYSRPMHVSSPIASTLSVTIRERKSGKVIDGWQNASFALKTVPTAVWGQYDPSLDPIHTSNPKKLLNGDNPNVPLAMGIILAVPLPILAPSLIPAFNATAAAKFEVLDRRDVKEDEDDSGHNWILKPTEPRQSRFLPAELSDAQTQETSEQRWEHTRNSWNSLKSKEPLLTDSSNGFLALAASSFGWDKNRPQTEVVTAGSSPPWQLVGKLPSKLVSNLESVYLALPRLAVVDS